MSQFMRVLPSEDAIKLANAIYQTYLVEDNPYLTLSVARLCDIYALEHSKETISFFKELFEELNEPVVIENFTYEKKLYKWLAIEFCSFEEVWHDEDEFIDILLNEMFLAAMQKLMPKAFIIFKEEE
ncbi:MAG: hypothetical protein U9R50_13080 [Campylobacterota bacterium]|nr:hypothetical protein [Campylobacterota bacterium]